jgi:NAD(P)-dependent dehydrogenase (short-subunit alcohol dehydrogenase family)
LPNGHSEGNEELEMSSTAGLVLVTGASRGIGAATAREAARQGHDVVVNFAYDEAAAHSVVEDVLRLGRRAVAIRADVGDPDEVQRLFREAEERLGPLHALVNNTGITGPSGPFMRTTDETIERVLRVNVMGVMRCAREALAGFARHSIPGVIVNVSSVAARTGSANEYVHYAASKAAVDTFTLGLAREVAGQGIRVCGLAPGSTLTGIHAAAGEPGRPARVAPKIPMGRLAEPEEIAAAIVWLLSPAASYMTGTTVSCAGGI